MLKTAENSIVCRQYCLYEPNIRHVYSPCHYCNVCKARGLMPNVQSGCYAVFVKKIRALTEQLLLKTSLIGYSDRLAAPGRRAVPTFVATPHVWYPGATPTHSRGARSCRSTCCMCKSLAIMRVDAHHPAVSDESLPHADAAAFDAAGCRTTLVRGVRVVGGHGRRTSGVIRTVRARGGGEFSSGRRGATVDDERRVTTERRSTRWGARTAAAGCCSSTDDPPGS